MKVRCSSECSCANDSRGCWVPRLPPRSGPFGPTLRSLFVRRPPQTCAWGFILPRAFRLLQSATACDLPVVPSDLATRSTDERLPWGPLPHRGLSRRRPPLRGESRPRAQVPSSPFRTTSRVCSASSLCGLVSSRCHVQGLPFRGLFLAAEPYRLSPAASCPLVVGRLGLRFDPRQPPRPRLQGLAPRDECGAGRGGLDPGQSAPLLGFLLLRVFSPRNVQVPSHPLRPRPWTAMNPPQLPSAFRRCADWLAWDQAACPLEVPGLNPRPPFGNRVRGHATGQLTIPPDTSRRESTRRATGALAQPLGNRQRQKPRRDRNWTLSCARAVDAQGMRCAPAVDKREFTQPARL